MKSELLTAEARDLSIRLRHLSREMRDSRSFSAAQREWCFRRSVDALDKTLAIAYRQQRLHPAIARSIQEADELAAKEHARMKQEIAKRGRGTIIQTPGPRLARIVVGYARAVVRPVECGDGYDDLPTIEPGAVAAAWPGVFLEIHPWDGHFSTITDPKELWSERLIDVIGYYASACDLMADWIDRNPIVDSVFACLTPNQRAIVRYLQERPEGVTYEEFMNAKYDGMRLTTSRSKRSIQEMVNRLSNLLIEDGIEIKTPEKANRIRLQRIDQPGGTSVN